VNQTTRRMLAVTASLALAVPVAAQESYSVSGDHVAIYNLAGETEVVGTNGGAVQVRVTRGGADGSQLDVQVGPIAGRETLRVIYPSDRVHYEGRGWGGSTDLRVRADGTWGGNGGDRVRVSSRRSGLDAHADLRVEVPRGQRIDLYLAVGRITASNVDGEIRLDTHAGGVEARDMAGDLVIDTGSGAVTVRGMAGNLNVDTGSGGVEVSNVTADEVIIDTGSGGVDGDAVEAGRIEIDTGSGGIRLRRSAARDLRLDTGSGSVTAELSSDVDELVIDTGSGSVTLVLPESLGAEVDIETGSGGIDVDFPINTTRWSRDELRGRIGDGQGSIRIDTGSGGVRIRHM
jgi:lia operon protein LiaG